MNLKKDWKIMFL